MGHVDALAARVARQEVRGDNSITWVDGREYKLMPELYFDAVDAWGKNDRRAFVEAVLADPSEADDFLAPKVGWRDLNTVWDLLLHGGSDEQASPGESSASPPSSKTGGRRSRPTSSSTTDST